MKNVSPLNCLSIIAVCSLFLLACRKEKVNYNHLSGVWPMMGKGCAGSGPCVSNAFTMVTIAALDEHRIVVNGDTLQLQSSLSNNDETVFKLDESANNRLRYMQLNYDRKKATLTYDYQYNFSNAGASYTVSTEPYHPNANVRDYVSKIAGTKQMTGTFRRSLPTGDSSAELNITLNFSALNDSTIEFRETLLQNMSTVLHYMATDADSNSVIFQSQATLSKEYSVLTYNYISNSFVFEQVVQGIYYSAYVKLQ